MTDEEDRSSYDPPCRGKSDGRMEKTAVVFVLLTTIIVTGLFCLSAWSIGELIEEDLAGRSRPFVFSQLLMLKPVIAVIVAGLISWGVAVTARKRTENVAILYLAVSALVWVILAGLLILTWLQHRVSILPAV